MSSIVATAAMSALFLVALAPLALPVWNPKAALPIGLAWGSFTLGVAGLQAGFFQSTELPSLERVGADNGTMTRSQCAEVVRLLEEARVILARDPPRLVVARAGWEQLPEEGREAVVECVSRGWPRDAGALQVELTPPA